MASPIAAIGKKIRDLYVHVPSYVRGVCDHGHPVLAKTPRVEDFGGHRYAIPYQGKHVLIERARDYERVKFTGEELCDDWITIVAKLDEAIARLGDRMECCLTSFPGAPGYRESRNFDGSPAAAGMDPLSRWEGPAQIYSLGQAPQLLDDDGETVLRILGEDACEVRFGYYANTGPVPQTSPAFRAAHPR